ncbi:MAG: hypothetical protein AAGJ37_17830, partial [Pseudomonadota bacterium]
MKELPTFYYHDHFIEFLSFIKAQCAHLLHPMHSAFISEFEKAPMPEQALLVRCINRKQSAIKSASLIFKELNDIDELIFKLIKRAWLKLPTQNDASLLLRCLTKDELFQLCITHGDNNAIRKSLPKAPLLAAAKQIPNESIAASDVASGYLVRNCDHVIDYFLYLYFGNCRDR